MAVLAERFPGYGWERNQGYCTPEHRAGIARLGVTPLHRRSFRPVREALAAQVGESVLAEASKGLSRQDSCRDSRLDSGCPLRAEPRTVRRDGARRGADGAAG